MADQQTAPINAALRALPPMPRLLLAAEAAGLCERVPPDTLTGALRTEVARLRAGILAGDGSPLPDDPEIVQEAMRALSDAARPHLRRVLNATGIVVHTNLGRAPLAPEAIAAMVEVARENCNLEFDLDTGRRGARAPGVEALLCALTGAEAALAVNNNAAAVLLALTGLAQGGEVIVSRGELVEIGGGFRVPDIIRQCGGTLVEVGTTNKTRLADYAAAVTPHTRLLLKVHQSNFRIVGFTEDAGIAELAALARGKNLLVMDDLGSGTLTPLPPAFHDREPTVRESLAHGADIVAFSGDKLLGGPQAGLLAGRAAVIDRLRRHPLLRALRLDKTTLAGLEATLLLHRCGGSVPVLRMLAQDAAELQSRAEHLSGLLAPICAAHVVASTGHAGGGALPGRDIPSRAVSIAAAGLSADALARRLRRQTPALVGRIHDGKLLLDVLTLRNEALAEVAEAVGAALA